jgi:hypothetical protein
MSDFSLQLARRFSVRHLVIVLAAVIASFALLDLVYRHALDSLIAFRLEDSDPAVRNSLSAVVVGLLLIFASALAFAAARLRPDRGAGWWRAGAIVLAFFGVEEALGLHTWVEQHADVSWNVAYLPFLAIAAIVWFEVGRLLSANRAALVSFGLGAGAWLVAGLFDAARTHRAGALPAGELLEMAAAALMLVGMFAFARNLSLARDPVTDKRQADLAIARSAVSRLEPARMLLWFAGCAIVLGILGAIVYPGGGDLRVFDVNKEQTFPATFSGLLLLAAGGLALLNGVVRCPNPADRRWWLVLAAVFAFLGIDEIAALHEAVQDRVHLWGQATLAPIVIAGVAAWFITLNELRSQRGAAQLFMLGAAAWVVSQGIDAALNEHYGWTVIPEELFEMLGSALFGLALLVAVRELLAVKARERSQAVRGAVAPVQELQTVR